jgi:predicted DNA-binding protein
MPRPRRIKLGDNPYNLPVRLPRELGEWLRIYALQRNTTQNAIVAEAIECLRDREDKAKSP